MPNPIESLRPLIAATAQGVYDDWQQDADSFDPEYWYGGICDAISDAIASVLCGNLDCHLLDGGQPGDDHAYNICLCEGSAFAVDIPAHLYETGGGYRWRKKPDVTFTPDDVDISVIPHAYVLENYDDVPDTLCP